MSYIKRQSIPKSWPIPRKGTTYVVRAKSDLEKSVPVLVALRDILKIATIRKEVKGALHLRNVLLNGRPVLDEKNSISLLDIITLVPSKKNYRLEMSEKGKFVFNEVKESEVSKKVSKIIGKKILKGKKTQLNLLDGMNFLSETKCSINDSVLIDLKNRKIEKILPLKEKSEVLVFAGKHIGEKGLVIKIDYDHKMVEIKSDKENFNVLIKQIMVIN